MNKLFGTDGIRNEANKIPLDPASIVKLGQAIGKHFLVDSTRHTVLIGKDTRLSGYMIEYSLAAGLTSAGANVYLTGPIPTAAVAYLTRSMRADAGIMVSASHNPYEDNGIKIFAADGFKLPDETEAKIEGSFYSDTDLTDHIAPQSIGKITRIDDAKGRYIVYLKSFLPRNLSLKGLKIGLDCANGAAYQTAPLVFDELGAEVVSRGVSPSGKNINSGFGSLYPEIVSELVVEHNLDVGFAFDGDSDRLVVVDEKGNIFSGDKLLVLLAEFYAKNHRLHKNTIVSTVMSNIALDDYLKRQNIQVIRSKVGDRYVLEKMQSEGLNLGGEESGHIIFLDDATCGDGILSAIKVLEIMQCEGKPLSQLVQDFNPYPRKVINLEVKNKPILSEIEGYSELEQDISSQLLGHGRFLVRYSGTEDKLRILVESSDEKQCENLACDFQDFFQKRIGA